MAIISDIKLIKRGLFIASFFLFFSCNTDITNIKLKPNAREDKASSEKVDITAPKLTNNPSYDVICTNIRPLLTFFKSRGGVGKLAYTIQLDTSSEFNSNNFIEYKDVEPLNEFLVQKRTAQDLVDKSRYYFRAKAIDSKCNESRWHTTRFYIDTDSNKTFMNLSRIKVENVKVSTNENPKNLIDYDDPGQVSFWQAAPPGPIKPWAIL